MTEEKRQQYYKNLEILLDTIDRPEGYDRSAINDILEKFAVMFRLCKGTTEFFENVNFERVGKGITFTGFDHGVQGKPVLERRVVSKTKAVMKGTLYMEDCEEPLDEEEREKCDLLIRVVVGFVARERLSIVVEKFGFYDEVGYPNQRSFNRFIGDLVSRERMGDYAAFHYDLHHFSVINREVGRKNGDDVIRNFYKLIKKSVGRNGILCRLGGDKFMGMMKKERIEQVLELLAGSPVPYGENENRRIMVSACTGVFMIPEDRDDVTIGEIMDKIVSATVASKRMEGRKVVFFDAKMRAQIDHNMWVQRQFQESLEQGEFVAFYQPKVDVFTGKIVGAEALCRWFWDGKMIPPAEFIPVLEQNASICDLDFYILDTVCKDIRKWLDLGNEGVKISVNLSRKHLVDMDLLEHILEIIDRNNVPHNLIEIELTETTTDVQFRDLKRVVNGLQRAGVSTAVDDFGMGYSSLNLIREIPWDVLKIDRSFLPTENDDDDTTVRLMFKHLAALARDMGLECVVEGVETKEHMALMRENGCTVAQGFYFDKPLPKKEFEERLHAQVYPVFDGE